MQQNFTILFDLDGTLVDTAPDLMRAHNHVMKKFGYPTKSTEEIRNLVGQGAGAMLGRSIWGQAKKEFGKVQDEKIKKEMGTAVPTGTNTYPVKGRDLRSGTPKEVNITEEDTAEALNDILKEMVNAIKDALENTPPELSADLVDMGLTLTGGGSLLKNIDKRFSKETGLPVHIADDPLSCVAVGTGKALDQEETFSTMLSEY